MVCDNELGVANTCVNSDAACSTCFDPSSFMDTFPADAENFFHSSLAFKPPTDPEFCIEANWRICKKFNPAENGEAVSEVKLIYILILLLYVLLLLIVAIAHRSYSYTHPITTTHYPLHVYIILTTIASIINILYYQYNINIIYCIISLVVAFKKPKPTWPACSRADGCPNTISRTRHASMRDARSLSICQDRATKWKVASMVATERSLICQDRATMVATTEAA